MAYITNKAFFGDLEFFVDERTIVPRSLIGEVLVSEHVEESIGRDADSVLQCLDLCCGSGFLGMDIGKF